MNGTNLCRFVTFLSFLLLVVACTEAGDPGPAPANATASPTAFSPALGPAPGRDPTPTASPVPPSPAATATAAGGAAASLVEAGIRERGRYDETVTIEVEEATAPVALPGLSLYVATPLLPDLPSDHCAVAAAEVWCNREALPQLVRHYRLGANPGQLDDAAWLALVAFFTGTEPLAGPGALRLLDGYLPAEQQARIGAPLVTRPQRGGLVLTYYYESVAADAYPDGPMALRMIEVVVTEDNRVTVAHHDVWSNEAE